METSLEMKILLHMLMLGWQFTLIEISVISWWIILLQKETGVPRKNTDMSQITDSLLHKAISSTSGHGWERKPEL